MTSKREAGQHSAALDEKALVAAAGGGGAAPARTAAVKELARRKAAAPVLASAMLDDALPIEARTAAAVALGKEARPDNERALERALRSDDPRLVRRAAEALGRIGGAEALASLVALPVPVDPPAARALAFARSLVGYRLGLDRDLLRPPPGAAPAPAAPDAESLRPGPIDERMRGQVAAGLREELPAIPVALEGGVQFSCGGQDVVVLPHAEAGALVRSAFVPAVVLKRTQSLGGFAVHLYLLSHSVGEGRFALFGIRPDGTMTHVGEIEGKGEALDFRLVSLDSALSPPFAMEGRLLPGPRLDVAAVRVAAGASRPGRMPNRQG